MDTSKMDSQVRMALYQTSEVVNANRDTEIFFCNPDLEVSSLAFLPKPTPMTVSKFKCVAMRIAADLIAVGHASFDPTPGAGRLPCRS